MARGSHLLALLSRYRGSDNEHQLGRSSVTLCPYRATSGLPRSLQGEVRGNPNGGPKCHVWEGGVTMEQEEGLDSALHSGQGDLEHMPKPLRGIPGDKSHHPC